MTFLVTGCHETVPFLLHEAPFSPLAAKQSLLLSLSPGVSPLGKFSISQMTAGEFSGAEIIVILRCRYCGQEVLNLAHQRTPVMMYDIYVQANGVRPHPPQPSEAATD